MKTNQTFSIRFRLRTNRIKGGKAPIYLAITVNKKRCDVALKHSIKTEDWHILKGLAKPRTPELKSLNYYLESVRSQILQYYQELQIQRKLITAEVLKNMFLGIKEEEQYTLCSIIQYHNNNMQLTLAKGTTKNYYTTEKYLKEFLIKHYKTSDIYLRELNYQFIIEFEMFLRRHAPAQGWKKLENNGTMKHLERLRKMVNLAVKLGWIDKSPFVQYIDAPNTTDFAILFLPFESLYAEVLRTPGLFESIQRECRIIITGPTTLSALLNSLQMGFRTLAIEKRSGEVWQLLSAVKTEFGNFSGLLDKASKNIQTGLDQLENVVGVRTRAIQKRLKGVEVMTDEDANKILPTINDELLNDNEEEL